MGLEGLEFHTVPLEMTGGMETRLHRKLRLPGKWDLLTNCTNSADGTPRKRDGQVALVAGATGNGLARFGDELLVVSGSTVSSVSVATGNPTPPGQPGVHAATGQAANVHIEKVSVARATNRHLGCDAAVGAGLEVYVWQEYSLSSGTLGVWMTAVDQVTGAVVKAPYRLSATGRHARVTFLVPPGANYVEQFLLTWVDGAIGSEVIMGAMYMPRSPIILSYTLLSNVATIGTGLGATHLATYDVVSFGMYNGNASAAIAYVENGSSGQSLRVAWVGDFAGATVVSNTACITEAQQNHSYVLGVGLGVSGTGLSALLHAFTCSATHVGDTLPGTAYVMLDSTFTAYAPLLLAGPQDIVAPTHVTATVYPVNGVSDCVAYVDNFAQNGAYTAAGALSAYRLSGGSVTWSATVARSNSYSSTGKLTGPWIAGRPIVSSPTQSSVGVPILPVMTCGFSPFEVVIQGGIYLLDGATGAIVGRALYAAAVVTNDSSVPNTPFLAPAATDWVTTRTDSAVTPTFLLPALEFGIYSLSGPTVRTSPSGVVGLKLTVNAPLALPPGPFGATSSDGGAFPPRSAQLGRATYLANGALSTYDSQSVGEAGFAYYPEGFTVSRSAGGGTWAAGQFAFVAIYEWVDGQGQRHQSAPSPVYSIAVTANDTLTFSVPTLQLTSRSPVALVVYGTQANGTTMTRYSVVGTNDKTSPTVSIVATAPVSAAAELLYSQPLQGGTTLPNDAPGPCSTVGVHQGRLWLDLADRPGAYRYSQQLVDGVGLQFSELLGGQLPAQAGKIRGWASMDEMLVILAERGLYRVTGTGPSASGAANGYSDPVEIPSDVGCSEPASVCLMPQGVIFKSPKGWYRLSRDLTVKYIGGPVKTYDADSVTSAVMMGDRQEVRISSAKSNGNSVLGAVQLVYSYETDTWSVFQINSFTPTSIASTNSLRALDSAWWPALQRWVTLSYYDGLNYDSPGAAGDKVGANASAICVNLAARSSFFALAGLEGFQRVRWLYLTMSAPATPNTSFTIRLDYDDVYASQNPPGAAGSYITSDVSFTYTSLAAIDVRHKLRRQKCKSVAITINEFPKPTLDPTSQGITGIQALALNIGVRKGTNKLAAGSAVP